MKSILLLLLLCGSVLFISGCWDRMDINDLALVTAAAIDRRDDNQVELSIQMFIPRALSGGGGQTSGGSGGEAPRTLVVFSEGSNVADALSKIQGKLPRKVFWGQCKVFIFGEELAMEGIQEHMDFLLRHPQIRERAYLFVSEGKAKQLLNTETRLERHTGEVIQEQTNLRVGVRATMQDTDEMLVEKGQASFLPYLVPLKVKSKEAAFKTVQILGTAVFKNGQMVGTITEMETRGLLWLRNEIKGYTVNVKPVGQVGELSLNPVSARVGITPSIQGGRWKITVKVNTEGAVVQNNTDLDLSNPKSLKEAEEGYQKAITQRIESVIQKLQHELNSDIIGFANVFYQKYPKQWEKVEHRWDEVFPEVEVTFDVEAHIRRQGNINKPLKVHEEELNKR